ncbi:tRNA ligase 1 [Zea mays]|uniref:tRNA ligase 1 n=1 Tax=Zea mays TaxID=4577 RepID=A0A3L6DX17_MAIZE|nr:tRNA ligase 1 [Zea mays]
MSPACSLLSPHTPWRILPLLLPLRLSSAVSAPALAVAMPRRDGTKPPQRKWKPKAAEVSYSSSTSDATELVEPVRKMTLASHAPPAGAGPVPGPGPAQLWVPRGYTTFAGDGPGIAPASTSTSGTVTAERDGVASEKLSRLFKSAPGFEVDNSTFTEAQIRATFYPKFENEKSDQETRTRMIEMVSHGLANLEVTLKHSGSLFMYAGHHGGAYAKNSFGNVYTAVGVFVLGRLFREAWGKEAPKMQAEFNDFLEKNRVSISMELVTAVLGDHGQRPKDDYAVVTAVTELGNGKPKFYSTPEVIALCRKWRLPTNHVWLFSTRKSASSFFAAYDALCEEGTATPVCKTLDEIADIAVPGSKDHVKVQGEILEGLVARIVPRQSLVQMEEVLKNFPQAPFDAGDSDLGPSLREICAANRSDEKQQIKALLENVGASMCPDHSDWFGTGGLDAQSRNADRSVVTKFLQAHPADYATKKLQEMIRLMKQRHFSAAFKCYWNYHKIDSLSNDNLYYKMVIHVHNDSVFRRYQQEMRRNQGLWPLYRGFFVDVNLFKANNKKAAELAKDGNTLLKNINGALDSNGSVVDGLADEDSNLMVKLKFLTYKWHNNQVKHNSRGGQDRHNTALAVFIRRKYGNKPLSSSTYLSEAEPFLEQYAKRSPANQALIGAAGNLVQTENFLAILDAKRDEEGDLRTDHGAAPSGPVSTSVDVVPKTEGLIVFFPGIPGCAKSALCKEILNTPGGLGDDRPFHSLMGDLIKVFKGLSMIYGRFPDSISCVSALGAVISDTGHIPCPPSSILNSCIHGRYWQKVADERRKKPAARITLADKNAPNEEATLTVEIELINHCFQIEDMCGSTKAAAVPVVPDSEGVLCTDSNPFSLEALAVFMFRVLQRVNHPGNLDKASPNAGYVLLMFYHLYDGKSRREFENELYERFGSLVKMPLLKPDRAPLPDAVKAILDEGISLFKMHRSRHGRAEPSKGSYAKEWAQWEQRLRATLFGNADHLNSIQVPFDYAVKAVLEQLKAVAKGDLKTPDTGKRKFGNIMFAAVRLTPPDILGLLRLMVGCHCSDDVQSDTCPMLRYYNRGREGHGCRQFLNKIRLEDNLTKVHVTLAHKRGHGVSAVASYGIYQHQEVPVSFNALYYTDKMAALEAQLGAVNDEPINSRNEWPHATLWTAPGVTPKEANMLPQLASEGKAERVPIDPPITISGVVDFY